MRPRVTLNKRRAGLAATWAQRRKRMTMIDRLFGVSCADTLGDRVRMRWALAAKFGRSA